MKGNGVGNDLWLPWRPLLLHHPSAQSTWRKGAPIALNMWCFPDKTLSLIHDEPHPNHPNNVRKCFFCHLSFSTHERSLPPLYLFNDLFLDYFLVFTWLLFLLLFRHFFPLCFSQGCGDEMLHNLPELGLITPHLCVKTGSYKQNGDSVKQYTWVVCTLYLQISTFYCEFLLSNSNLMSIAMIRL